MRLPILAAVAATLSGCAAETALDVVTLPVKVVAAGVDAATTSQAEADRKLGREIRKREECLGREERRAGKQGREPDYAKCEPKSANRGR